MSALSSGGRFVFLTLSFWLVITPRLSRADNPAAYSDPLTFFTNVAEKLLMAESGIPLDRIQIYPTNQYSPSVHRLLQLAANLYDSTTNRTLTGYPYLPSVFRPLFKTEAAPAGPIVFISGYEEVTNATAITAEGVRWVDLMVSDPDTLHVAARDMVYGIPLIVGVKKGHPNFNDLISGTTIKLSRFLEFRRDGEYGRFTETNQMYVLSVSNSLVLAAWLPYSNSFPRDLNIRVSVDLFGYVTNEDDTVVAGSKVIPLQRTRSLHLPGGEWHGFVDVNDAGPSFQVLISETNSGSAVVPAAIYRQAQKAFEVFASGAPFERNVPLTLVPHLGLHLRQRLRFEIVDTMSGRLIDYANIVGSESFIDILSVMAMDGSCRESLDWSGNEGSFWCTNLTMFSGAQTTIGFANQLAACLGYVEPIDVGDWVTPELHDLYTAIDFFRNQFGLSPRFNPWIHFNRTNVLYSPFVPSRTITHREQWRANDPILHHRVEHLQGSEDAWLTNKLDFLPINLSFYVGRTNKRYEPWGGNPSAPPWFRFSAELKDPMVNKADAWDFPSGEALTLSSMARVHRGTPWQTVYLKSMVATQDVWASWMGVDELEGKRTHPTNDWKLFDLLAPSVGASIGKPSLPMNRLDSTAWRGVLDGLLVFTNVAGQVAEPMVVSGDSPEAGIIAKGIETTRAKLPGGCFRRREDLLQVPELTFKSPFIGRWNFRTVGDDRAYEALAVQLLPLVIPESICAVAADPGQVQLEFTGFEGKTYIVQGSTNLVDWTEISEQRATNGPIHVTVPRQETGAMFFRSVETD